MSGVLLSEPTETIDSFSLTNQTPQEETLAQVMTKTLKTMDASGMVVATARVMAQQYIGSVVICPSELAFKGELREEFLLCLRARGLRIISGTMKGTSNNCFHPTH
jgi:hypothetical protein